MENTVRESDSCHPIFRTWEIPYGEFNAGSSTAFPLTVFQKLSARPRTRRRPITMPNVKACAPLAQLCNVPRARQRIVSARYFAWDSPRLWPASGDAKLCYIESANSIGYPAETMLRCDQVGRVFFFFFRFRKWVWRGSSLIEFFLWMIPLKWKKKNKKGRIYLRLRIKRQFFFFFFRQNFYGNFWWKG